MDPAERAPVLRTQPAGLVRTLLAALFVGALIAACAWILYPFLSALIWATLLVVSTWPMMRKVERALWDSRRLAVAAMTSLVLLVVVAPMALAMSAIYEHLEQGAVRLEGIRTLRVPPPPPWARALPLVGAMVAQRWEEAAALPPAELRARVEPYASAVRSWIARQAGTLAAFFLHLLLTVILAAVLYLNGENAALGVRAFARRLAGARGEAMAFLSAQAIRAVALGVIVTAAAEALLAGIGLLLAGVPLPGFLTALVLIFAVAQIGPAVVLVPVIGWLYWKGNAPLVATAFLVWSIVIAIVDNVLRPVLIKRGAHLPLILIFAGVVGGLIAFGAVGLFVGPVVLAVTYTLLVGWVAEGPAPSE